MCVCVCVWRECLVCRAHISQAIFHNVSDNSYISHPKIIYEFAHLLVKYIAWAWLCVLLFVMASCNFFRYTASSLPFHKKRT